MASQKLFKEAIEGNEVELVEGIEVSSGLWIHLRAKKVLLPEQIDLCESEKTRARQVGLLLEQLKLRDNEHYEPFRKALEATGQRGVLQQYFPPQHNAPYMQMDLR